MEQALKLNVKTSSITMVRICLLLLSISTIAYCIINIFLGKLYIEVWKQSDLVTMRMIYLGVQ
jgi:hypothetical protein